MYHCLEQCLTINEPPAYSAFVDNVMTIPNHICIHVFFFTRLKLDISESIYSAVKLMLIQECGTRQHNYPQGLKWR